MTGIYMMPLKRKTKKKSLCFIYLNVQDGNR